MARTGENIYKRKDGRYEARYIAERDANGKAIYKSVYGYSKAEVREKAEAALVEIYGEKSPIAGKTFKQVAEDYLAEAKGTIASTTYDRYLDALERDVYPEYASTPMVDVTESEMNRFIRVAPDLAEKRGRLLTNSGLLVVKAVMSNVINYANAASGIEKAEIVMDRTAYEELTTAELEMICLKAKHNHCPEMLAALLSIFCGMRTGELCALNSDDVDGVRNEIYIHETAHRVRNPKKDENEEKKTVIIIEEIPRKKQIRRVSYPAILNDYIDEFRLNGRPLIRNKDDEQADPRTLENWLTRIMSVFRIENINFERLRKTYMNFKADEQVLNNIFRGIHPDAPYDGHMDVKWLTDELTRDLAPLRMLVGVSVEEAAEMLGVSTGLYRQLENGSREPSWDQYMTLLFMYHYNMRTTDIVNTLGLYPDALKEKIKIGDV
ncbi:phage integrase central domain-containing protein [Oribacterium sp. NK2B42]|uniref:phage integrase central domain-containing protein n=1 Tax=Oribacterium sp. NK2B42 TaxID=689781 RepID=UPI0004050D40|nr:helix-turn-helix domain-containing protein [Oribacterium sp. NK2B42]